MSAVVALRARRSASLEEQRAVLVRQLRAAIRRYEHDFDGLAKLMASAEYDELHRRITELDRQLP